MPLGAISLIYHLLQIVIQYTVFSIGGKSSIFRFFRPIFFNGIWETGWIWDGVESTVGQLPPACPCSYAGHTLPSPGDAGGQASSKFALCHQGEGTVSSLSPQLSPWWHPEAPQDGQCCCVLGFILAPYLPHCSCSRLQKGTGTPECLPCPLSLPPATLPSSPWLLRVSGGAYTACVAMVASLPWA